MNKASSNTQPWCTGRSCDVIMKQRRVARFLLGAALASTACTRVVAPIPVHIVADPPACWIQQPPDPPRALELKREALDVIARTTVNYQDHNRLIDWAMHLAVWAADTNTCLERLTHSGYQKERR